MRIEFENNEVKDFILFGRCQGRPYSKWKSNSQLRKDIDKVMRILNIAQSCKDLYNYKALNYEPLKYDKNGMSSVRLGFTSKFRLLFEEFDKGIRISIIEISEHYGDK